MVTNHSALSGVQMVISDLTSANFVSNQSNVKKTSPRTALLRSLTLSFANIGDAISQQGQLAYINRSRLRKRIFLKEFGRS